MTTFRESIVTIAPAWLGGYWGSRYLYTIGIHLDSMADWIQDGIRARFPGEGPPSALGARGADMRIERGPAESDDHYVGRLQNAWDAWRPAGNPPSVVGQILGFLSPVVPRVRYVNNGRLEDGSWVANWMTWDAGTVAWHRANPANFDWDGHTDANLRHRWWLVLYQTAVPWFTLAHWGTGGRQWGDGSSWGSDVSPDTVRSICRLAAGTWKAAGSQCLAIMVTADLSLFDPSGPPPGVPAGNWQREYIHSAGVAVPTRPATVLFWRP